MRAALLIGSAAVVALGGLTPGCAVAPSYGSSRRLQQPQPIATHASLTPATRTNEPVRSAAVTELGPEAANAIPRSERPAPKPIDPGAKALVESMLLKLQDRRSADDGVTRISVCELRNQSRSSSAEFSAFQQRFAALLTAASRESKLEFTTDGDKPAQYRMQGAAYLVTLEGFDHWELFLSLTPNEKNWTLWQAERAIHVLRQPSLSGRQIR